MPLPTSTDKIIAAGAWVQVRVKDMSSGAMKVLGLCTDVSYSESFGIADNTVINHVGPVSIDAHGYQCSIQIGSFVPENPAASDKYADGGEITLSDLMPSRVDVAGGIGRTFYYMDFYNKAADRVIDAFAHVVVADGGKRAGANAYVTHNISLRAMERTKSATQTQKSAPAVVPAAASSPTFA